MLKIRDDVDLKELKKFRFEKINDIYRYSSKEAKNYVYESVIYLYDYERIIRIDKLTNKDDLNILYDLIKADLIVKE